MSKDLPPLGALRAFDAATRHLSFVRAAAELHVTPAAVSHQVKLLESWLKLKLFTRSANGVALTAAGRDYAARIQDLFGQLADTTRAVRHGRQRTAVAIQAQFSMAAMWLLPRLTALQLARPDIELSIAALPDKYEPPVKADIVINDVSSVTGYERELILRGKFRVYASPSTLARCPKPTPMRLLSQPLIHTATLDRRLRYPGFADWFEAAEVAAPPVLPGMTCNLFHLTADACVMGAGFALLLDDFCLDSVRAGSLIAIGGPALDSPHPQYLHLRNGASDDAEFTRQWLLGRSA